MTRELLRGNLPPSLLIALTVGHGRDEVERRLAVDVVHHSRGEVLRVGGHQGRGGSGARISPAMRNSSGVAWLTVSAELADVKHTGWALSPSRQKKVCAALMGFEPRSVLLQTHVPMAVARRAVRVDEQQFSRIMPADAWWFSQPHLKSSASATVCPSSSRWTVMSLARKGNPLSVSNPRSVKPRPSRSPLLHRAASWTNCSASRGSMRSVPSRPPPQQVPGPQPKCSGTNSHRPAISSRILSASR